MLAGFWKPIDIQRLLRTLLCRRAPSWADIAPLNPAFAEANNLDELFELHGIASYFGREKEAAAWLRYVITRSRVQMEWTSAIRTLYGVAHSEPFTDRRVIDFCLSLPPDQFLRNGQTRALARRAFADRLTPEILSNYRRGLQDTEWHRRLASRRDRLQADLERFERSPLASRILDVPRLQNILSALPDDPGLAERNRIRYMQSLELPIHVGRFLLWLENGDL